MTDQIYYKVQYPLKKALSSLKKVDIDDKLSLNFSKEEKLKLKQFIQTWEEEGKDNIRDLIDKLKKHK